MRPSGVQRGSAKWALPSCGVRSVARVEDSSIEYTSLPPLRVVTSKRKRASGDGGPRAVASGSRSASETDGAPTLDREAAPAPAPVPASATPASRGGGGV